MPVTEGVKTLTDSELHIEENVALAAMTSMKLGGPARFFAACSCADDIRAGLAWAASKGVAVQVLAGGSNTIVADAGFGGLVLKIASSGVRFANDGASVEVAAAAGEDWDALVLQCIEADLSGIECLSGIPGSVGATPMQNVGAYGQEVSETITSVRAIDRRTLKEVNFGNSDCRFRYRRSRFKSEDHGRYVIFEVSYRLEKEVRPALRYPELVRYLKEHVDVDQLEPGKPVSAAVRDSVLTLRRRKSMVLDPEDPNTFSVGSFFLNPVLGPSEWRELQLRWRQLDRQGDIPRFEETEGIKIPAAWLVEQAGFQKGSERDGAAISKNHALAIINCGGGAAAVLGLASEIQKSVSDTFGVQLQREPEVVE